MNKDTRDDAGMNMAAFLVDARNEGLSFEVVVVQVREKFTPARFWTGWGI